MDIKKVLAISLTSVIVLAFLIMYGAYKEEVIKEDLKDSWMVVKPVGTSTLDYKDFPTSTVRVTNYSQVLMDMDGVDISDVDFRKAYPAKHTCYLKVKWGTRSHCYSVSETKKLAF